MSKRKSNKIKKAISKIINIVAFVVGALGVVMVLGAGDRETTLSISSMIILILQGSLCVLIARYLYFIGEVVASYVK